MLKSISFHKVIPFIFDSPHLINFKTGEECPQFKFLILSHFNGAFLILTLSYICGWKNILNLNLNLYICHLKLLTHSSRLDFGYRNFYRPILKKKTTTAVKPTQYVVVVFVGHGRRKVLIPYDMLGSSRFSPPMKDY